MKRTMFHKTIVVMLISALAFGQIGAGFLHNKHDAHEAVIDLDSDHPVLLNHGEHCKVCSIDWVSHFVGEFFEYEILQTNHDFVLPANITSPGDFILILKSNRAPPALG